MFCQQQYDENLQNNPFFREIQSNHSDILQRASQESWIVAVPRAGILEKDEITDDLIWDHILIPAGQPTGLFYTLSKKQLSVQNKQLVAMEDGPSQPVQILFEETFYTGTLKCSLLCIAAPLFSRFVPPCNLHYANRLETLHDCIDYLWSENLGCCLGDIHEHCSEFEKKSCGNVNGLQKRVNCLFEKCLGVVEAKTNKNCDNVQIAVETYMQSCLNSTLVKLINTQTVHDDANLNRILRRVSSDLQLKALNIPATFSDCIIRAKHDLAKLNDFNTILDKINCLKSALNHFDVEATTITSDLILQVVVFLIVKIPINNWISNLTYMTGFRFSASNSCDSTNFILTTFEAAIAFIQSDRFEALATVRENDSVFQIVSSGSVSQLSELLVKERKKRELCHPLCSCDKCFEGPPTGIDLGMTNERGQSLLMAAGMHGRLDFVEFLLNRGVPVDFQDYSGKTALHYAAGRGHQSVVLMLVAWQANVNRKDNEGMAPLHHATLHGHENCVKALLYSGKDLDINALDKRSETALHLATRWNYAEIIRILIENHIKPTIKNNKKQTAFDLVNNWFVHRLLKDYYSSVSFEKMVVLENRNCYERLDRIVCQQDHGQRAKTLEQIKKIDLLLKAIENNDLPLTCFYLGFSTASTSNYTFESKCHPLCNCEKCAVEENVEKTMTSTIPDPINVNMCNFDGITPLHIAAKFGRRQIVRILLDSHASPRLKTYQTLQTPLHFACIHQHLNIVKELVSTHGIEIDAKDYKGNTPLYYAAIGNAAKIVEILLENGASCEVINNKGISVAKEVQERCLFGIGRLLKVDEDSDDWDFL